MFRFIAEVGRFRDAGLHSEGHLIVVNPVADFDIRRAFELMFV